MKKKEEYIYKGIIVMCFITFIAIALITHMCGVNTKVAINNNYSKASSDELITESVYIKPIVGVPPEDKKEIILESDDDSFYNEGQADD